MKSFKQHLQEKGNSKKSIAIKELYLNQLRVWSQKLEKKTEELAYKDLIDYIQELQNKGLRQVTIQLRVGTFKDYYHYIIKTGIRTDHPIGNLKIKGVQQNKLYSILEAEELKKLYQDYELAANNKLNETHNWHLNSQFTQKRNKAMLGLMVFQGLTNGELTRIECEDLKLREGKIYIRASRKNQERIIALESEQLYDLMEYVKEIRTEALERQAIESNQLFFSYNLGSKNLNVVIVKLMKKLRIQNPKVSSSKQIRASVITYWLKRYNLRQVQYRAGHKNIKSTEKYLINDLTSLQEDINIYSPF
ncbi:MAG: site-specific integrase [Flavobacteriales bacterium]|nr:site-specific integrase [Flavobacteriales bacterium]